MTGNQWVSAAVVIGCMVLVGSSLMTRNISLRRILMLAGAWIGIFTAGTTIAYLLA